MLKLSLGKLGNFQICIDQGGCWKDEDGAGYKGEGDTTRGVRTGKG